MYKVTKRYPKGPEIPVGQYKTLNEARNIIQTLIADDVTQKIIVTYYLYEGFDLLEEIDQSKLTSASKADSSSAGGQQKGSGQRFVPTPFNMSPAPKGSPRNWLKDEEENGEDEKKK